MTEDQEQQKPLRQLIAEVIAEYINQQNLPFFSVKVRCPSCGTDYTDTNHRCVS